MRDRNPVYFVDGAMSVSANAFRTASRTIFIGHIEKTQLRRPGLIFAAALAGLVYASALVFAALIYPHEWLHILWPPLVLLLAASQVGMLSVHTKALGRAHAAIGWHWRLQRVRAAIDQALEDRTSAAPRARDWMGDA